jgi:hypothetical protein
MSGETTVYLIVHELFGILFNGKLITLVTPIVEPFKDSGGKMQMHEHKYRIARFSKGNWHKAVDMVQGEVYSLQGVKPRTSAATSIPCRSEFSPNPPGVFTLDPAHKPFCQWDLSLPKQIHQLRLVSIPECDRPAFVGDPHGDAIEAGLKAIALVHAFEYEQVKGKDIAIVDKGGQIVGIDYKPDTVTNTINLHLWAQLENEAGMTDPMANKHAGHATDAMVQLFKGMVLHGTRSLSIDNWYPTQVRMPAGVSFPELMTLSEKFMLQGNIHVEDIECTHKTCGYGGNFYVNV